MVVFWRKLKCFPVLEEMRRASTRTYGRNQHCHQREGQMCTWAVVISVSGKSSSQHHLALTSTPLPLVSALLSPFPSHFLYVFAQVLCSLTTLFPRISSRLCINFSSSIFLLAIITSSHIIFTYVSFPTEVEIPGGQELCCLFFSVPQIALGILICY